MNNKKNDLLDIVPFIWDLVYDSNNPTELMDIIYSVIDPITGLIVDIPAFDRLMKVEI